MSTESRPVFGVGAVLEIPAADYMYGTGTLALRITTVSVDPAQYRQIEWINVLGREVSEDGRVGDERVVTIRVSAIGAALRPPAWRPPNYASAELPHRRSQP